MQIDRDLYLHEPPYDEISEDEIKKQEEYDSMKKCLSMIKETAEDIEIQELIEELENEIGKEI